MSRRRQSLSPSFANALTAALESHVQNLNGQDCGNLHRLVLSSVEEELMKFAVDKCGGNLSEAARMLGISRTTIARKLNGNVAGEAVPKKRAHKKSKSIKTVKRPARRTKQARITR